MSQLAAQPQVADGFSLPGAPRFVMVERQPLRPGVVMLAALIAAGALSLVAFGLGHSRRQHLRHEEPSASRAAGAQGRDGLQDDDDDPNQVDVIALGDAADAPVPARRFGRAGSVHPTIIVRLPRFGPEEGLIPNSPVGHLLYEWLAAFNQTNAAAMAEVLPSEASGMTAAEAQMELRRATGGLSLLSAKEVAPGVLVFRMRDQTPDGTEVLGTLVMRPGSEPPEVQSFSMRAVPPEDAARP